MRFVLAIVLMFAVAVRGQQQTPTEILAAGKAFQQLDSRSLEVAQLTLLSYMVYGQAVSPSAILAQGAGFQALSDKQLQEAIATLLNQLQGGASGTPFTVGSLLDPPHVGVGNASPGYNPFANSPGIATITGSGIVRNVWIVPDINANHFLNTTNGTNVYLQVFVDGAGATTADFQAVSVPLANLFGDKFRFETNGPYNVIRDSAFLYTQDTSSNAYFGAYVKAAELKLPMPFTNSITIRLWNSNTASLWVNGYMTAFYESGGLSFPFSTYRLRSGAFYGYPPSGTNTLIQRLGSPGLVVGMMGSYLSTNGVDAFDTVQPVFQTSSNVTRIASGYSDLWKDPYSFSTGFKLASDHGTINSWIVSAGAQPGSGYAKYAFEVYQWFVNDHFVFDSHGLDVISWNADPNTISDLIVWYYSP